MHFQATQTLLDAVEAYIDIKNITISTENTDWRGRPYTSDFVTLFEKPEIHFEVFENEIIVGFFTEHTHFEDYSCDLEKGCPDYIQRAREFLEQLFTFPIRKYDIYKGVRLCCDKYYFILPDGTEDFIGGTWHKLFRTLNPFAKKQTAITVWQYNTTKKCFAMDSYLEHSPTEIMAVNDQYRIEIYERNGTYRYRIEQLEIYDDGGYYCWTSRGDGLGSFFDTKENAVVHAKAEIGKLTDLDESVIS